MGKQLTTRRLVFHTISHSRRLPGRCSISLNRLDNAMENQSHAHRGDEKTDNTGGSIDSPRSNPAQNFLGVTQEEVRDEHRSRDGDTQSDHRGDFKFRLS
jgi:hypothetical protein